MIILKAYVDITACWLRQILNGGKMKFAPFRYKNKADFLFIYVS